MKFVTQAKSATLRSSTVFGALLGINKNRNLTTVALFAYLHIHTYIHTLYHFIILLAVKPAFGGFHCYGAPSTVALQRRSGDCDSTTVP